MPTTIGIRRVIRGLGITAADAERARLYDAAMPSTCPTNLTDAARATCSSAVYECVGHADNLHGGDRESCLAYLKRQYANGPFKVATTVQAPALPGYSFSATEQAAILAYWRRVAGSGAGGRAGRTGLRGLRRRAFIRGLGLTEAELTALEMAGEDARDDYEAAQAAAAAAGGTVVSSGPRSPKRDTTAGSTTGTTGATEDVNLRVAVARVFTDFCAIYPTLCSGGVMSATSVRNFGGFIKIVAVLNKRLDDAAAAAAARAEAAAQAKAKAEAAAREQAAREQAAREQAAREQAARDDSDVLQAECQNGYMLVGNECLPIEVEQSARGISLPVVIGVAGAFAAAAFVFFRRK